MRRSGRARTLLWTPRTAMLRPSARSAISCGRSRIGPAASCGALHRQRAQERMLREIVLDTEPTGTDPAGDRIVEIGCVELLNHIPTGRTYHVYVNPQRPMSQGAFAVHGLSDSFLADKPVFAAI